MKTLQTRQKLLLGTAFSITLAACGGGGTSGADSSVSGSSGATYSGTVSGLGSIVVNGVRFSTADAVVTSSDDPTEIHTDGFKLGTTVVVTGSVNGEDGQAASIEIEGGVRGVVSLDAQGNLVVAGQVITVDANTIFDGEGDATFTLSGIASAVGAGSTVYVEVYGTVGADGSILATRIEKKNPATILYAIKGYVVPGSLTSTTFSIQIKRGITLVPTTLTVNYDASKLLPRDRTLRDGVGVRVLTRDNPKTSDVISASKVLIKKDRGAPGSIAKVHGVVSAQTGNTWTIDGISVDVSQSPVLRGFASLADVTVGTEVRIGGVYNGSVLTAKVIESDDYEHDELGRVVVKLFGVATGVNTTDRTFSVQGVTVKVPSISPFNLPTEGSYVEVLATQINGVLTAVTVRGAGIVKPFEVYGLAACTNGVSDLQGTFAMTVLPVGTVSVDGSTATIKAEDRVNLAASVSPKTCVVEVKGTMTTVNEVKTLKASRIEIKARR